MEDVEKVELLAFKKAYLHSLRYITDDVIGILVGQINNNEVSKVVDAFPLFHSRVLAPTLESALEIIESVISSKGLKIVGIYESPVINLEDITLNSSDLGQKILEKIFEIQKTEPIYMKITDMPIVDNQKESEDQEERHILTSIVSRLTKKQGDDYTFKKVHGSGYCQKYFDLVSPNIENGDYRKIIDFDSHFEDISLDFTNSYIQ